MVPYQALKLFHGCLEFLGVSFGGVLSFLGSSGYGTGDLGSSDFFFRYTHMARMGVRFCVFCAFNSGRNGLDLAGLRRMDRMIRL